MGQTKRGHSPNLQSNQIIEPHRIVQRKLTRDFITVTPSILHMFSNESFPAGPLVGPWVGRPNHPPGAVFAAALRPRTSTVEFLGYWWRLTAIHGYWWLLGYNDFQDYFPTSTHVLFYTESRSTLWRGLLQPHHQASKLPTLEGNNAQKPSRITKLNTGWTSWQVR